MLAFVTRIFPRDFTWIRLESKSRQFDPESSRQPAQSLLARIAAIFEGRE